MCEISVYERISVHLHLVILKRKRHGDTVLKGQSVDNKWQSFKWYSSITVNCYNGKK